MDVYDLVNNIEVQGQINYCYYDYEKEERVIIDVVDATFRDIKYLYAEGGEIFIEVEYE